MHNNKRNKVNLAVLILAHKTLKQIERLAGSLQHPNIFIFLHLDKKWDLSEVEIKSLSSQKQVYICDNRISAFLDKWSLVEATMEAVRKAKQFEAEKDIKFQYFALLSGQDYPIKPVNDLLTYLTVSYPKPFIDCTQYHPKNWLKKKFKTLPVENEVQLWFRHKMKPGLVRKIAKFPVFVYINLLKLFKPTPYKLLRKLNIGLYGGSAWWVLPDVAMIDIYSRFFNPNDEVVRILSNTFTPEETFFQIMTMQTNITHMVELNPLFDKVQNCLTYAHFRDAGKPFVGHPYALNTNDFDKIVNLNQYFARKFDIDCDEKIFKLIDEKILLKNE